jgi:hypothetical protein
LKADATVVDLNRLGPHFYQTGLHLAAMPTNDSDDIAEILPEVKITIKIKITNLYLYDFSL